MKRLVDMVLILIFLPILLPLSLIVALVVRLKLGSPVFFLQERAGLKGKPFRIIKFRSMTDARDPSGMLLPDADRLPPFGHLLRRTSLDELPELWNVLRGEMSLIGPRPLPVRYVQRYSPEQAHRLDCLPGITGWAQVNGRNLLDWDKRFRYDCWYVDNRGFLLDMKILFMTIITVLRRDGISAEDEATMTEFMGPESGQDREHSPREA